MDSHDKHLDGYLDRALQQYGSAEPRSGLEGRIMANLAIAWNRSAARRRWGFSFATVAALCAVSVAVWLGGRLHLKTTANTPPPLASSQDKNRTGTLPSLPEERTPARTRAAHRSRRIAPGARVEMASASPRLDQFPSQRPLSEQEQLLKTYVSEFPKEAAVVAREQAQREKELEALYPDITESDSEKER